MMGLLRGVIRRKPPIGVSIYQGAECTMGDIRIHLSQFPGGSIDLELDEGTGIATICLNHPEKKNSISGKMMVDLEIAVDKLETWEVGKGLLIIGKENNFCSGGDLNFAQKTGTAEGGYKMATFMQNVLVRLQKLPMISVAFIEGYALGGGAELAINCDFRIFSSNNSAMGFVHTKMGIIPAWGGLTTAIQTLGYRTALDLVTTGRVVRAEEALRLGLCDEVVSDLSSAKDWLAQRVLHHTSVVRAAKCVAINTKLSAYNDETLEFERRVFAPLWGGPPNKQALSQKIKHKN